jgi:hypothetical protein
MIRFLAVPDGNQCAAFPLAVLKSIGAAGCSTSTRPCGALPVRAC